MIWYAHGGRAPSAKRSNDLELYELALDMHIEPDRIRRMNIRDRHHLFLVNKARKLARQQMAMNSNGNVMPSYVLEV
jgi:hypothetical protein